MACTSTLVEPARSREVASRSPWCSATPGRTALGELLDPEVLRLVMSRSFDTMETAPNAITISTRSSIVSRWVRKGSEKS